MRFATFLFTTILSLVLMNADTGAYTKVGRKKKESKKNNEKEVAVQFKKNLILGNLHGGYLKGEANQIISRIDDNTAEKILYGFGISYDRFIKPNISLGISYNYMIKSIPGVEGVSLRSNLYGIIGSYFLTDVKHSRPYLKAEFGRAISSIKTSMVFLSNIKLETVSYYKVGIGFARNAGANSASKIEIYYKKILSKDTDPIIGTDPFDITFIGVSFGVGIPF